MPSAPIVAFSKDWQEDPTSNHHVLRELAKTRRVVWLNSIGTRAPELSSSRDLGKMRRKVVEFARGPVRVENDLWVFSPVVIPLPHHRVARRVNLLALRATLASIRARLAIRDFHLWTFLPNVAEYVGGLDESLSVYYCVDEWSMFSYLDRDATVASERALLAKVDCVFAVNEALASAKRALNPTTYLTPHGVDHSLFARALADSTAVPSDIASLPRPIVGFYGTLREWVDLELVARIARARPEWSFVLIGQQLGDMSAVLGIQNVHLLGRRPHETLPAYCKGMDVGLIPYRVSDRLPFVNPTKLREYLSAGLAVVSTAIPEVRKYDRWCTVADDAHSFTVAIEHALHADSPETRRERSDAMRSETWPMRVAHIARLVEEEAEKKRQRTREGR